MLVPRDGWENWEPDRGAVIEHLTSLVARGRLGLSEFEDLAHATYAADSYEDLAAIVTSAPPLVQMTPAALRRTESLDVEVGHGQVKLDRRWQLAAETNVFVRHGQAIVDLSVAEWDAPVVDLTLEVGHGQIVVVVPDGVRVTFDRVSANVVNKLRHTAVLPGAPELRLYTDVGHGQIQLRSPKLPWRVRRRMRRNKRRIQLQ